MLHCYLVLILTTRRFINNLCVSKIMLSECVSEVHIIFLEAFLLNYRHVFIIYLSRDTVSWIKIVFYGNTTY